jgi:Sec1 family
MASQAEAELDKRRINVKIFLEHMKQKFAKMLDTICSDRNAPKDLVTVPEIRPLFELIIEPKTLEERKVSLVWLDEASIAQYNDPDVQKLIFFVPPTLKYVKLIKEFHNMLKRRNFEKKLYLVYYPKRTMMCKYYMDTQKLLVLFENSTFDFNFDLIPLYSDLLSLEYKPAVEEILINSEFTCYNLVAESIQRLQMVFGKVPTFLIKGDKSKIVFDILKRLEKEHGNKLSYEEGKLYSD